MTPVGDALEGKVQRWTAWATQPPTRSFTVFCATLVAWTMLDFMNDGRATAVGAATAIVVGLVAITPAAGFVSPIYALLVGAIAAVPSYYLIQWRARTSLDDSLDVLAAHGLGGATGAILTGVFAQAAWGGADGLVAGNGGQVLIQLIGVVATFVYSGLMTFILLKLIGLVMKLRADEREEGLGLDVMMHSEEAYSDGEGALLVTESTINGRR